MLLEGSSTRNVRSKRFVPLLLLTCYGHHPAVRLYQKELRGQMIYCIMAGGSYLLVRLQGPWFTCFLMASGIEDFNMTFIIE
jgi:hypothetical protein